MKQDHIPAPAEHSPRKESIIQNETDLLVYETENPEAHILCETGVVEVRQ